MIKILEIFSNVWPYVVAVIMFLLLILIHELGHFVAAKATGVRVNEFSIGFGPKIFKKTHKETTYLLKLIPFGGYCAMEGEDEDSTDSRAFCNKAAWQRGIVVVMGAVFNLLLGFVLVGVMMLPQKNYASLKIAQFDEGSVSSASLAVGDEIVSVDGRKIYTTYDLSYAFTGVRDGKLDITVLRDGEKTALRDVQFKTESQDGIDYVSLDFKVEPIKRTLWSFLSQTFLTTVSQARVVWFSLIDLISGKFGISAMSGPVGVTAVIGSAAKQSLMNLIPIMSLITINLGVFNLLPLPALDGGRLLFIIIEMIIRKPIPKKFEGVVHTVGFLLLILLMIAITAKDIWALVV